MQRRHDFNNHRRIIENNKREEERRKKEKQKKRKKKRRDNPSNIAINKQKMQNKSKNKQEKKQRKKAQEEMFGFMLIVAVVMIIGFVLLFLIKPKEAKPENAQIDNMIYSMFSYTVGDKSVRELTEKCYDNDQEACKSAKDVISNIIEVTLKESSLVVGQQLYGYSLNITNCNIPLITEGNLSGNMFGSYTPITKDIIAISKFYY